MTPAERDCPISILVVEDEEKLARSCLEILAEEGHSAATACRGRTALEMVRRDGADILLTDLILPDMTGIELLQEVRRVSPETLVIVVTGLTTVEASIRAMQAGAHDYIAKPYTATQLRIAIGRAAKQVELARNARKQVRRNGASSNGHHPTVVGSSEAMRKVMSVVDRIASTEASVFISGESGTGKELVARALHDRSHRAGRPFVAINCAAMPDQLLESELFGHEKGSFTGADAQRQGLLERASGGTFLLDEITEMSLELQAKLLRVVQERRIRRVGGAVEIPIDIRWVSATNRDPDQAMRDGQLRQDLYFRLNVVPIRLPPLRARPDDIPVLASSFLRKYAAEYDRPDVRLGNGVLSELRDYSWPGNVRELQNLIERLVSLSSTEDTCIEELPDELGFQPDNVPFSNGHPASPGEQRFHEAKANAIAAFEKAYVCDLLQRHGGNISRAAREAGMDRKTIHRLLLKYQISDVAQLTGSELR